MGEYEGLVRQDSATDGPQRHRHLTDAAIRVVMGSPALDGQSCKGLVSCNRPYNLKLVAQAIQCGVKHCMHRTN